MNWFERFLYTLSPGWAAKRQQRRFQFQRYEIASDLLSSKSYEGASKSARMSLWNPSDNSANEELRGRLETLRQRSRDLIRSNPYALKAQTVVVNNTVGTGVKVNFEKANSKRVQKIWDDWTQSTKIDSDGISTLSGLQGVIMGAVFESGEVLVRRRFTVKGDKMPFTIQVLESDFLDSSKNEENYEGGKIVQGIQFDALGNRTHYWLFDKHPGGPGFTSIESKAVPADEIKHIFLRKRPNQDRGAPWLHSVMVPMHELDKYLDATLKKQQLSACFSAFIYDATGEGLPGPDKDDVELTDRLDAGTMQTLPTGKDIKFANPPTAADLPDFVKAYLNQISSGVGITYEQLTNDFSSVNYSSSRMSKIEANKNIRNWQEKIIVNQFLMCVVGWFKEALEIGYFIKTEKLETSYTYPGIEYVDPDKEIKAIEKAITNHLTTISSEIRKRGEDPNRVFEEIARERKKLKELGITTQTEGEESEVEENNEQDTENGPTRSVLAKVD